MFQYIFYRKLLFNRKILVINHNFYIVAGFINYSRS